MMGHAYTKDGGVMTSETGVELQVSQKGIRRIQEAGELVFQTTLDREKYEELADMQKTNVDNEYLEVADILGEDKVKITFVAAVE